MVHRCLTQIQYVFDIVHATSMYRQSGMYCGMYCCICMQLHMLLYLLCWDQVQPVWWDEHAQCTHSFACSCIRSWCVAHSTYVACAHTYSSTCMPHITWAWCKTSDQDATNLHFFRVFTRKCDTPSSLRLAELGWFWGFVK